MQRFLPFLFLAIMSLGFSACANKNDMSFILQRTWRVDKTAIESTLRQAMEKQQAQLLAMMPEEQHEQIISSMSAELDEMLQSLDEMRIEIKTEGVAVFSGGPEGSKEGVWVYDAEKQELQFGPDAKDLPTYSVKSASVEKLVLKPMTQEEEGQEIPDFILLAVD